MKRKVILGLILSAITTLALLSCSNGSEKSKEEDKGSKPILNDVFFFSDYSNVDKNSKTAMNNNKITEMLIAPQSQSQDYGILIDITDPDGDARYLELSWDGNNFHKFNAGYPFPNTKNKDEFFATTIGWDDGDNTNGEFKPLYCRVLDSKNNISDVFTVNIKISAQ